MSPFQFISWQLYATDFILIFSGHHTGLFFQFLIYYFALIYAGCPVIVLHRLTWCNLTRFHFMNCCAVCLNTKKLHWQALCCKGTVCKLTLTWWRWLLLAVKRGAQHLSRWCVCVSLSNTHTGNWKMWQTVSFFFPQPSCPYAPTDTIWCAALTHRLL